MAARAIPYWPRVQRARLAAEYAGFGSERAFLAAVNDGLMPPPFTHSGADAWDTPDLDAAIEAIKAGASRSRKWQERAPARV